MNKPKKVLIVKNFTDASRKELIKWVVGQIKGQNLTARRKTEITVVDTLADAEVLAKGGGIDQIVVLDGVGLKEVRKLKQRLSSIQPEIKFVHFIQQEPNLRIIMTDNEVFYTEVVLAITRE